MHKAKVRRNLIYRRADGRALRMDVYLPRTFGRSQRLPAVLVGGPEGSAGKDSGQKIGWSQLIAASGMAAVAFDFRSDEVLRSPERPSEDVAAALAFVRARAGGLGIDPDRICTLGFSVGTAPWHLWATMREPAPYARCNVAFYGPLDFAGDAFSIDPALAKEFSALTYLQRHGPRIPPLLVARAGREPFRGINASIERFLAEARTLGADVRVVTHERGVHGFDVFNRDRRSREIVRQALAFFRARLAAPAQARALASAAAPPPLRLRQRCVTRSERARVIRFRASDGARLIGVQLGTGAKGVVLAHQGGGGAPGNLCAWMPYARSLAGAGYRVLAFDHRYFGSSSWPRSNPNRVDLDVVGAVRELRRRGAKSVVLAGASLGGAAVLAAATRIEPQVNGVISLSTPQLYVGIDVVEVARRLSVPALFVAAEEDLDFADDARALYEAAATPDKQLAIFPGRAHGAPMLRTPAIRDLVTSFIQARLAG